MSDQYLIDGIPVKAVKSAGGGFYEVTVLETEHKMRSPVDGFEAVAVPYLNWSDMVIGVIQDETIAEEDDGVPKI